MAEIVQNQGEIYPGNRDFGRIIWELGVFNNSIIFS